jgi:predicted MFS family arabinose efflux permease
VPPPPFLAWLVWSLGALLYLIAYYHRVAPAVITRELSAEFGLSGAALGNLSAFYFYSYAAVQIPTGLLADRWGPRRVLTLGAALTAAGTVVFALAPAVAWADAGRFAIGAAAGVAFVSMLKLASHWMHARQFAFASGVALFVGVMGATLAGVPLRALVDQFSWRPVMLASAAVTACAAIAIWLVVRDDPVDRGYAGFVPRHAPAGSLPILAQLRAVSRERAAWLMVVMPGGTAAIVLTFPGLWGVPFLVTQYGFTAREAASVCSTMLIAWAVSCMAFGPLSERMGRRKPVYAGGLVAMLVLWSIVVFVPALPRAALLAALVAVSVACGTFILTFALAKESVPPHLGGTISGIANMGVMLGGMVMQPLVGLVLDRHWAGRLDGGVRVYDFAAYQWGFGMMLGWCALSLALLALIPETYCRPRGSTPER